MKDFEEDWFLSEEKERIKQIKKIVTQFNLSKSFECQLTFILALVQFDQRLSNIDFEILLFLGCLALQDQCTDRYFKEALKDKSLELSYDGDFVKLSNCYKTSILFFAEAWIYFDSS